MKGPFIFLGDLIETDLSLPINMFEDFWLKKATEEQIIFIKHFVDKHFELTFSHENRFEYHYTKIGPSQYNLTPLEKSKWKYFVIEHNQKQAKREIEILFALSELDLTVLFEAVSVNPGEPPSGKVSDPLRTLTYFHDNQFITDPYPIIKKITSDSLSQLIKINHLLIGFGKNKYPLIEKALSDFVSIKEISERSPFKILSCFSILELLLTTYRPRNMHESSLSYQLRKKINLLNNQLSEKIILTDFFKGPDTLSIEIVIEKLYQYRNDIAHGNITDFENDLQIFKDQKQKILPFLFAVLRKLLVLSLERPQLITDVKEC